MRIVAAELGFLSPSAQSHDRNGTQGTAPARAESMTPRSRFAAILPILALLAACSTMAPQSFEGSSPRFDPVQYFDGPTRSWGVIESRRGNPRSRFRTEMMGRREGDALVITQDFTFEDGRKQQRVWRIRRVDDHRYEATSPDVSGIAPGVAYGNAFHWEYELGRNPFTRVHMNHWMYLQAGGEVMINRVIISKLGVILAETTEHFHRGTGPVPSVTPE